MKWRVIAGFAIGILALGMFIVFVGWDDVLAAAGETDPTIYALAFASTVLALACRATVWVYLLKVLDHELSAPTVGSMYVSAKFFKYISPYGQVSAPPGIAWFVGAFTDADYERNLAAILSADMLTYTPYYSFGGIALLVTLLGAAALPNVEFYLAAAAVIVVVVVVVLWTLLFRRGVTERLVIAVLTPIGRLLGRLGISVGKEFDPPALRERIHGFYGTIDELLETPRRLLIGVVFGHLGWVFLMLPLLVVAQAMGIELGLTMAILVVALSKIGFLVPLPGGIAGVEFTIAGLLVILAGISTSDAVAVAILYRFSTFWFTVLIGGITASVIVMRWPGRGSFLSR